jgi:hypothetical protein
VSRKPSRNRRRRAATINRIEAHFRRRRWYLGPPGNETFFRGYQEQPLWLNHRNEWQAGTRTFRTRAEAVAYLRTLQ